MQGHQARARVEGAGLGRLWFGLGCREGFVGKARMQWRVGERQARMGETGGQGLWRCVGWRRAWGLPYSMCIGLPASNALAASCCTRRRVQGHQARPWPMNIASIAPGTRCCQCQGPHVQMQHA